MKSFQWQIADSVETLEPNLWGNGETKAKQSVSEFLKPLVRQVAQDSLNREEPIAHDFNVFVRYPSGRVDTYTVDVSLRAEVKVKEVKGR